MEMHGDHTKAGPCAMGPRTTSRPSSIHTTSANICHASWAPLQLHLAPPSTREANRSVLPTNHTPHHIGQYRIPGREARACHHPHAITRVGNKRARALPCDGRQRSTTDNYVRAAKVRERKLCSSAKELVCTAKFKWGSTCNECLHAMVMVMVLNSAYTGPLPRYL